MLDEKRVALIGAGVMAETIAAGLVRSKLVSPGNITVSHYRPERLTEIRAALPVQTTTDNRLAYDESDIALLCVRPQAMASLLSELDSQVIPQKLLISIAAGLPIRFYDARLGSRVPFVRAMPTFFGRIKAGTTGLSLNAETTAEHLALASQLFATISENVVVLPEHEIDAFTTFGSTTTATIYLLLDALITAGSLVGLRHQASHTRAIEQVIAAARNVEASDISPAQLLEEICTPGGVTVEGVKVLEERAARGAAIDAILAAMERARTLAKEAEA
ncbi:MAG TPA: pyrroline-5-carboxylate reductase dimerization domain-containing protein [Chloroflexota bacterium]|nr:pyrroline-5-carboxylate reductase dimerization domain-containing protein [Chloroflexota bacterium]